MMQDLRTRMNKKEIVKVGSLLTAVLLCLVGSPLCAMDKQDDVTLLRRRRDYYDRACEQERSGSLVVITAVVMGAVAGQCVVGSVIGAACVADPSCSMAASAFGACMGCCCCLGCCHKEIVAQLEESRRNFAEVAAIDKARSHNQAVAKIPRKKNTHRKKNN